MIASSEVDASAQALKALQRVLCIQYLVQFQESQSIRALIDSGSNVNAMTPAYAAKLGLTTRNTSVGAQKIGGSPLETHGMTSTRFSIQDSLGRVRFFPNTFLLTKTSMEIVIRMLFLTVSYADFQFGAKELTWRSNTVAEALPTTTLVERIDKKEFGKAALDGNSEIFVMHIAALEVLTAMPIHPSKISQLQDYPAQIAALQWDKALTEISTKFSNYADVFSSDLAIELPENTRINKHAIELIDGKQSPYRPIYSFSPVELETLNTYIKPHLKTGFIRPSKSPTGAPILFNKKLNSSLSLYVYYQGLNNHTIKNRYLLPFVGESLDRLGQAKRFTQLDLTSAYYWMRIQEKDEWKKTFCTRYDHFEYQVMFFGLSNAPASF